jgi:hypothetical protein
MGARKLGATSLSGTSNGNSNSGSIDMTGMSMTGFDDVAKQTKEATQQQQSAATAVSNTPHILLQLHALSTVALHCSQLLLFIA